MGILAENYCEIRTEEVDEWIQTQTGSSADVYLSVWVSTKQYPALLIIPPLAKVLSLSEIHILIFHLTTRCTETIIISASCLFFFSSVSATSSVQILSITKNHRLRNTDFEGGGFLLSLPCMQITPPEPYSEGVIFLLIISTSLP